MNFVGITPSIVRVGLGRGFVIGGPTDKLVLTAAHCLPSFPPCHGASFLEERTYRNLVSANGEGPTVWVQCLFVDPVSDLAILGPPDDQVLFDECKAYHSLTEGLEGFRVSDVDSEEASAWPLFLDGEWRRCTAESFGGRFFISDEIQIDGGMSGSPIVLADGSAVGLISVNHGPQPRLMHDLPGWLVTRMS